MLLFVAKWTVCWKQRRVEQEFHNTILYLEINMVLKKKEKQKEKEKNLSRHSGFPACLVS
jgi:hypothetical protein